ncbi:Cof-type HAD-IIB family hydrolase [Caldicellulosiruptoraceae bacterium PP1]
MYKLVALDLDMTLLNKDKKISTENIKAVQEAYNNGIYIVLCSGRILKGVLHFAKLLSIDHPIIGCNGAIVKDIKHDKEIFFMGIDKNSCTDIFEICKKEEIYFHYYTKNTMIACELNYSAKFYFEKNKELPEEDRVEIIINDDIEYLYNNPEGVSKFVITDNDPEKVDYVRSLIDKNVKDIETTKSDINILEVMKKGVNKRKGLEKLCNYLGINREEVVAIGDNENDIEMIEFAGFGVAMGNAIDELKEKADFITSNYWEDGVAEAIRYVLRGR